MIYKAYSAPYMMILIVHMSNIFEITMLEWNENNDGLWLDETGAIIYFHNYFFYVELYSKTI